MKRPGTKKLGVLAALILATTLTSFTFWVLATTAGARWMLTSLLPWGGVSFTAARIEGRFIDHLTLYSVQVLQGQKEVAIDRMEVRWQPLLLLTRKVTLGEVLLSGVRIQDNTPPDPQPLGLAWPQLPAKAGFFSVRIGELRIAKLSYRRQQERAIEVTSLAASVTWQGQLLAVKGLQILSPDGEVSGTIAAGFDRPALIADIKVTLAQPLAGLNHFSLQLRPGPASTPDLFVGMIGVTGDNNGEKRLELSGEVGMAKEGIDLRRLRLTRPAGKGVITGDGALAFTSTGALFSLQLQAANLDLAPELALATDLSASLTLSGSLERYQGEITLANRGAKGERATLAATFSGNRAGLTLTPLTTTLFDGSLAGKLAVQWQDGLALQGKIGAKKLNPARIDPAWQGEINFIADGDLVWPKNRPATGRLSATLQESSLHGEKLTGEVQANLAARSLTLTRLTLQGKGFDLRAFGNLQERLAFSARISDSSRLLPESAGAIFADGEIRWKDEELSGMVRAIGKNLAYQGTEIASARLQARLTPGTNPLLQLDATLKAVKKNGTTLSDVDLTVDGTLERHTIKGTLRSRGRAGKLSLVAGYHQGLWKGEISTLVGEDPAGAWQLTTPAPFALSADSFSLSPLILASGSAERLEVALNLTRQPLRGTLRGEWAGLNLARANPWLPAGELTGMSQGKIALELLSDEEMSLTTRATLQGSFSRSGEKVTLKESLFTFSGSKAGLRGSIELKMAGNGHLQGTFSSAAPFCLAYPEAGEVTMKWKEIDLALLAPLLPVKSRVAGRSSGETRGLLLPGKGLELDGRALLTAGKLPLGRPEEGEILSIPAASATWQWQGERLNGTVEMTLAEYGQARATFQLPLPARFPVAVHSQGPLRGTLTGKFEDKGMMTTLFPGMVRESFGELSVDIDVNNTWDHPEINGELRLTKAGAYLPAAGLQLQEIQLVASLEKDRIRIDSFSARSGPGELKGTGLITLSGWKLDHYEGSLSGEKFQIANRPDLQLLVTPRLTFTGTAEKIDLRGEVRLPKLKFIGASTPTVVAPSRDVVQEGRIAPKPVPAPLEFAAQVKIILGEEVKVEVAGIEAQLAGAVELTCRNLEAINSSGEILVRQGRYRTYGVNLDIVRGRLFFSGGPIAEPSLDFLALRTIGEVKAGVTVTGTLQRPLTKLYSEPPLPETDILAYIVLGHPLGSSGEEIGLVAKAARTLLNSGQAGLLQEKMKNQLGLSTLEIQGNNGGTGNAMGYKALAVTPPGAIPAGSATGITETTLTIGKYLTPKLYISYGRSLFTGNNLFRLRYDLFRKWQIETETGSESGADLFYKLEFK